MTQPPPQPSLQLTLGAAPYCPSNCINESCMRLRFSASADTSETVPMDKEVAKRCPLYRKPTK